MSLAFSGQDLNRWWATTPADAVIDSPDQIAPLRLYKTIRDNSHAELDPSTVVLTALLGGQVAGVAIWVLPKPLHRSESLLQLLYRKGIKYKDALED
jgi:hypothetical protein